MKRYVLEFANEFLKNTLMKEEYKERIRQIVECCKRGNISSVEAVGSILNAFKQGQSE